MTGSDSSLRHTNRDPARGWIGAFRAYLAVIAVANLAWETAQLPLYTIWETGSTRENVFAVLHCTVGDLLIALSSLILALLLIADRDWPATRFLPVSAVAVLFGVGYTAFSEWLNIVVRQAWEYSDLMPVLPVFGFEVGVSPLLQWTIIPAAAFWCARQYAVDPPRVP